MSFKAILSGLLMVQLGACTYFSFERGASHSQIAAKLRDEKKFEEAIQEYYKHIDSRLKDSRREAEENPFFYLIMIGDIYLEEGNTGEAIRTYLEAKSKQVEGPLVVDRIRKVAGTLRDSGKYKEAIDLLRGHRDLDTFSFDLDADDILKEAVSAEDYKRP
jgi:tetratricopeptide (TPR) repeat protein